MAAKCSNNINILLYLIKLGILLLTGLLGCQRGGAMLTNTTMPNRLAKEKSPYLLQHAHNPIDWFPWSNEAFEKAKAEDKPIFLSIGYSTCHWCHVMARESFEDTEVADVLNRNFVSIKVDREERPDVDAVYMNVCQALTGHGGWPLTIIMTPDQKPFFAATYLPKRSKHGMRGLIDLLKATVGLWEKDRGSLVRSGDKIVEILREGEKEEDRLDGEIGREVIKIAAGSFIRRFDREFGGFGNAPKFPTPHNLMFLLRCGIYENNVQLIDMVEKTLEAMYRGGLFDHVGYGFARYSTDNKWLAPHFEKMLYDNALLTIAYLEAFQVTRRDLYKNIAEKILQYVSREMTSPDGAFYSAQDADSEGVEGRFYIFSPQEVEKVLGQELGSQFNKRFDITPQGNFEGLNIPNLINDPDFEKHETKIEQALPRLLEYRANRYQLHKDDKILSAWNALMIVAYAKAYQVICDVAYLDKAEKAIKFIEENLFDESGMLYVSYRDGRNNIHGFLDDYAFMAWAYLALYEATFEVDWLKKSIDMAHKTAELFEDKENGGYLLYGENSEELISKPKELYDGAMPSGNSVIGYVLNRLKYLTGNPEITELADRQMEFIGRKASDYPSVYTFSLIAAMQDVYQSAQLVCVLPNSEEIVEIRKKLSEHFLPNTVILIKTPRNQEIVAEVAEFSTNQRAKDGKPTFYLCQNHACSEPVHSFEEALMNLL
jgi:uncharacterized protein YyaL (SSP411 family)